MRILRTVVLIAFAAGPYLNAQVFEVNGGTSSLYQAQGGTITARGEGYTASVGAGVVAGQFVGGANLTKKVGQSTYILGGDYIPFVLPTDIFDASHYLNAVGGGFHTTARGTDIFAFGGATSNSFSSPLFQGVRAENPAGILFLKRKITSGLTAFSNFVFSNQTTGIASLQWQPADKLNLGFAGGIGANQRYGAASLDFTRPWIAAKAAYINAGSQFHRVAITAPLSSEADRENVLVTLRPVRYFSIGGGRQNFLSPVANSQNTVLSTVNEGNANLQVFQTGLSASLYHSTYLGNYNNAFACSADRQIISRIHANASYLESRPNNSPKTSALVANISEILTPRLSVNELINHANGQTTVSFGGGFLSNFASVTAEYQTYYVPQNNSSPFEQALIIDVQVHLFHGFSLHGATFVAPDGKLRYTADAQALAVRQGAGAAPGSDPGLLSGSLGSNLVSGTVVDTQGIPVSGAALMIDQVLVYSNDEGRFELRERKSHVHQLRVMVDQFIAGFAYRVVSAPSTVQSSRGSNDHGAVVIVERIVSAQDKGSA
jgi:hypothetical protein